MTKFNENDIRPDKFHDEHQKSIQADIQFLQERKQGFVHVVCPSCAKENTTIEFTKNGFEYIECTHCNMLYISPRPTVDILREFYPNSEQYKFFNNYIFPASQEIRKERIFIPRVKKVLEYCDKFAVKKHKLLEIGAGYGTFCEEMAKFSAFEDIVGVEPSDILAETCSNKGYRVYNGLFEELEIHETFDVVVSFEVILHLFNPQMALEKMHSLLNKNALLMLTFPAWSGFDLSVLREHSANIFHGNLNCFTANSISILLEKIGFDILEITTPGELDVDIVKKAIEKQHVELPKFIKRLCVDNYESQGVKFQEFLKENNLSSNMMVVAKKR